MKTILVKGWMPASIGMPLEDVTEQNVREYCMRANRYADETACLLAYAECHADWSTMMNDDIDEINAFCDVAARHIVNNDVEWLDQHFV